MKKLIIKIGNETHELPYNDEVYSVEVSDKYVPKVGDCVGVECYNLNEPHFYWFKIKKIVNAIVDFSLMVREDLRIVKGGFFILNNNKQTYTEITPEELKAKYAEAGYDWDYESDTIKPLKWIPKDGDKVWFFSSMYEPISITFVKKDKTLQSMIKKGFLFKTKEECQKFVDYCLEYFKK